MFRSSYESVPEQLRKCSGAVTKVFRNSYKSSVAVISVPEQLGYADFLHTMTLIRFHTIQSVIICSADNGLSSI